MSFKLPDDPEFFFLTSIIYKGTSYVLIHINDENMDVWEWRWRVGSNLKLKANYWTLTSVIMYMKNMWLINVIQEHIFHLVVKAVFNHQLKSCSCLSLTGVLCLISQQQFIDFLYEFSIYRCMKMLTGQTGRHTKKR